VVDGLAKNPQRKQDPEEQAITGWNGRKRITNAVL
jgi:hypothetical protein